MQPGAVFLKIVSDSDCLSDTRMHGTDCDALSKMINDLGYGSLHLPMPPSPVLLTEADVPHKSLACSNCVDPIIICARQVESE